ncbi:MAG: hypothetical protein ACFFDQ_08490, partial [Candidatus Thorarchaeota archaeon]
EVSGHSFDGMSGKHIGCKDFWNFKWFDVSGYKWHDLDGDSDPVVAGEGLPGWTIYLFKGSPSTCPENAYASTTTDSTGYYEFTIKEPGTYFIRELLQMNWTMTFPSLQIGSETEDIVSASGYDGIIAVSSMDNIIALDFGNFEWFTVSGHKWHDLNGDGVWQVGDEPPLNCWIIYLFDHDPSVDPEEAIAWTYTACKDGYYEFLIKEAGNYYIREEIQSGWTKITPGVMEIGDATIPIVSEEGYEFTVDDLVAYPALLTNNDFGNFKWFTITGHKYLDYDGTQPIDLGLGDWEIQLYRNTELYLSTMTSSEASTIGYYEFIVKTPGVYEIKEVLKDKWTQTAPVLIYSPGDGTTPSVLGYYLGLVTSGVDIAEKDFWNFQWLSISGYKYLDYDGTKPDDTPLDNWMIELYQTGQALSYDSMLTLQDGSYTFTVKYPGCYQIKEVLKDKWTETAPILTYSPGDGSTPSVLGYDLGLVTSGVDISGKNFWNFQWLTISGHKYLDYNGNQPTDVALDNWRIELYRTGQVQPYDWMLTLLDGFYTFTVKDPGSYQIKEVLKDKWTETSPQECVSPGDGTTPSVLGYDLSLVTSGLDISGKNFWNFRWYTITGHKYEDFDGSLPTDHPLGGWAIELRKSGEFYAGTTTAEDGSYIFIIKHPGSYSISEYLQAEWTNTYPSELDYASGSGDWIQGYTFFTMMNHEISLDESPDFWNFEWFKMSQVRGLGWYTVFR